MVNYRLEGSVCLDRLPRLGLARRRAGHTRRVRVLPREDSREVDMTLPVVVCIGSASVCGDSLGPMVGDLLRQKYNVRAYVYGGTDRPVNGVNFQEYHKHIKSRHAESLIIAVDACVGDLGDVGRIKLTKNGVNAGGALGKKLERVGDIGILGVVASRQEDNLSALMAASYYMIEEMSAAIASRVARLLLGWEILAGNEGRLPAFCLKRLTI